MPRSDHHDRKTLRTTLRSSLMMLAFGFFILAYLVSIDRPEWFRLRPASGTAVAMAHASNEAAGDRADQQPEASAAR